MSSKSIYWMTPARMSEILKLLKRADLIGITARRFDRAVISVKIDLSTGEPMLRMSKKAYRTIEDLVRNQDSLSKNQVLMSFFDCNPLDPFDPCHRHNDIA